MRFNTASEEKVIVNGEELEDSSKFIITSVVLDIGTDHYLWPGGVERDFWGGIIGTLREEQSQLRAQKRPGSLYLFRSL